MCYHDGMEKITQRPHLSDYNDPARCQACGHKIGYSKSVTVGKAIMHDLRPNYAIGECGKAY